MRALVVAVALAITIVGARIAAGHGRVPAAQARDATVSAQRGPFAALDSVLEGVRRGGRVPAVGIAIVHRGAVIYSRVAGFADLERGVVADASTRFDWASIGKQFTAYAVSLLVEQGKLAPTDSARRFIPELDLGGAEITVDQLLHHTTGLEDTDGLYVLSGGRTGDPVTHGDLVRLITRQQHLKFAPGERHAYSNGGYTLLAEIVARITGESFATWTDSAVFARLGMRSSGFLDSPQQLVPGRALPYVRQPGGGYRASTSDLYPAAGGLFATVDDMAIWMRHVMRPRVDADAAHRLRTTGRLTSGDSIGYAWGLGWGEYRGRATLSHAGSGPATAAQLLMIPALEFGVVVAIGGDGAVNPSTLAFQAADLVLGGQLAPRDSAPPRAPRMMMITDEQMRARPAESVGVVTSAEDLTRLEGRYRLPDSSVLVVRARGAQLEAAFDGRLPYIPLFPLPDGRFVMVPWWDTYRFESSGAGAAQSFTREATARSIRGRDRPPAKALRIPDVAFTAATAARYTGWYFSDELGTTYQVALDGARLVLVHARHGKLSLVQLDERRFSVQGGGIAAATFSGNGPQMTGLELQAVSWGVTAALRRVALTP